MNDDRLHSAGREKPKRSDDSGNHVRDHQVGAKVQAGHNRSSHLAGLCSPAHSNLFPRPPMPTLPKAVVIGHGFLWKVVEQTAVWARRFKRVAQCRYTTKTISLVLVGQTPAEQADSMCHELVHAFWHTAKLGKLASEEQVATAFAPLLVAFIREDRNKPACDWIAEKARS